MIFDRSILALELLRLPGMKTAEFADDPTTIYEPYDEIEVEIFEVWDAQAPTAVIDFDGELAGEEKVVIGYLTLEQMGWFDDMSWNEQERALDDLRRDS
jgi:hypothetical protein